MARHPETTFLEPSGRVESATLVHHVARRKRKGPIELEHREVNLRCDPNTLSSNERVCSRHWGPRLSEVVTRTDLS